MPLTPTNMRVVDVARLLNSTAQGFVLAQARLYRQFNRVGFRIAATENTRNINLIKYIAWLCDERHAPAEEFVSTARSYNALNALDVLLGKDSSRATYTAQVETAMFVACICNIFASVTLCNHNHAAAVLLEQVNIAVHTARCSRSE